MKTLEHKNNLIKSKVAPYSEEFVKDASLLFTLQKQGHMERWEYGPSLFANDPAGGSEYWASLVKNPGDYYLTKGDIETILWSLEQDVLKKVLSDIGTVIELGPGSEDSILSKTLPFLLSCPQLKNYMAIDATIEQASQAAHTIGKTLSLSTKVKSQDYFNSPLSAEGNGKSAIVMWGSSLGNIDGFAGDNPLDKLISILSNFKCGLKEGDSIILCFDTETNKDKVLCAYNEINLRAQILSVLHKLKRDGHTVGNFDPRLWQHEAVWIEHTQQCAHMVYPMFDQDFYLSGKNIKIPAWTRFVSNNSYKFKPDTLRKAASAVGLETKACLQNGPIALLVATKV